MIYSSQNLEATQISINGRLDKQMEVYLCNEFFFSNDKGSTMMHAATQKNLKNIMLHERSQAQENTFTLNFLTAKLIIENIKHAGLLKVRFF